MSSFIRSFILLVISSMALISCEEYPINQPPDEYNKPYGFFIRSYIVPSSITLHEDKGVITARVGADLHITPVRDPKAYGEIALKHGIQKNESFRNPYPPAEVCLDVESLRVIDLDTQEDISSSVRISYDVWSRGSTTDMVYVNTMVESLSSDQLFWLSSMFDLWGVKTPNIKVIMTLNNGKVIESTKHSPQRKDS